uniref:N-acetylneuraminate synthase family protein n=1 Tax=Fulvivirga sp. TaxID=1931237 RepID=UPI00404B58C8
MNVFQQIRGSNSTFVIADIGSNHMQDLILAKESIDAAAEAGADAIKFQSIQLNELYLDPDPATAAFIKKLEFPEEWHYILKEYCDAKGIIFFSSPTYLRAVDLLEEVNVPLYKIASAQVGTFPQIVEKVAALQKPVIFSTGIAAYDEVVQAVRIFEKHHNYEYIILHCNSIYPTPPERVNLQMIKTYQAMFHQPVGYSDHTVGIHIASAAV